MMTVREARQRAAVHNARICKTGYGNEYRVTLCEWTSWAKSTEDKAYYTDDLEDAVCTAGAMRKVHDATVGLAIRAGLPVKRYV